MITEGKAPPFTAYRIRPDHKVVPVQVVDVEAHWWGNWFVTSRRGTYRAKDLYATEAEAVGVVIDWIAARKPALEAAVKHLAALEARTTEHARRIKP